MANRVLTVVTSCALVAAAASTDFIDVFVGGQFGYACYRIPAIVRLANGTLLAFAEGRKFNCDDHGWNDIVQRSSSDGGATWGPQTVVYGESTAAKNVTIGNPAPVVLSDGMTVLMPFCRNNIQAGVLTSTDGGSSWPAGDTAVTLPINSTWTWVATGPPGSLQLPSGRIMIPIDYQSPHNPYSSTVFFSDDGGRHWNLSSAVADGNECQAAPMPWVDDHTVLLSMRSSNGASRYAALSTDAGQTWSEPWTTIAETQCEGSTIALPAHPSGPLLAISSAFSASARENMTIHTSSDNGRTWAAAVNVYPGSSAYSALVDLGGPGTGQAPGGLGVTHTTAVRAAGSTVGLLFERDGYSKISFATVVVP